MRSNTLTNAGRHGSRQTTTTPLPLYQPSYGTSFSSPLVAATAGLMKAVNPALTPALLIARIKETARAFPTTDELGTTEICVVPADKPTQDSALHLHDRRSAAPACWTPAAPCRPRCARPC